VAWQVFTGQMTSWGPLAVYKIGKANAVDAVMSRASAAAGMSAATMAAPATWGRVLVWEPASRLVLTWDIDADLQYDPALQTEIEVRIIAEQDGSTRVELKHRRLDRFGNRRDEMRAIYDKAGDWGQLLVAFAQAAETSAKAAAT
jgi:uncharacterized protein YndB with AHSA1/START domain